MGWTTANDEQRQSASEMVGKMMKPKVKPLNMSYTRGWDLVVSYSEKEINDLLRHRYNTSTTKMVKNVPLRTSGYDRRTDTEYTTEFDLTFGAPQLQFNGQAQQPCCSLTMPLLGGTMQDTDSDGSVGKKIEIEGNLLRIKINGIPLGSVRGTAMSENMGELPKVESGTETIHFSNSRTEEAHVTLDFPLDGDMLKVTCESDLSEEELKKNKAYKKMGGSEFQDALTAFFCDKKKVNAISYTLASLNNKSPPVGSRDLVPTCFQMATFSSVLYPNTTLSLFIETENGAKAGQKRNLQTGWAGQWVDNENAPVPPFFTASIILSASLAYKAMLKPGFDSAGWSTEPTSNESGLGLKATKRSGSFYGGSFDVEYSALSTFSMYGFSMSYQDFPMELLIKQNQSDRPPATYMRWSMYDDVSWCDHITKLPIYWSDSKLRLTFRVTDASNKDLPREVPCKVQLTDETFDLEFGIPSDAWAVDFEQTPGSKEWDDALEIDPPERVWDNVKDKIRSYTPSFDVRGMGLNFLRTTNLLTPDQQVIDFNEEIGVRIPRDFVLLGDIIRPDANGSNGTLGQQD